MVPIYIQTFVTTDEVDRGLPSPDLFLLCAERLSKVPIQVLKQGNKLV